MTKEKPFSATFKLEKETKNTVRYVEEAEGRRPVVGMVYIDKYELSPLRRLRRATDSINKSKLPPPRC